MTDRSLEILAGSAMVLACWPDVCARLLARHVAGPDGRCRGCPSALHVAPLSPCRIAELAATARGLHDRREERTGRPTAS